MDGVEDATVFENGSVVGVEVGSDDEEFFIEFFEADLTEGAGEVIFYFFAVEEASFGGEGGLGEAEEVFFGAKFGGEGLELFAVVTGSPEGADVGAHAGAGDAVDGDIVFFEDLDDADIGEGLGSAGGEGETDAWGRGVIGFRIGIVAGEEGDTFGGLVGGAGPRDEAIPPASGLLGDVICCVHMRRLSDFSSGDDRRLLNGNLCGCIYRRGRPAILARDGGFGFSFLGEDGQSSAVNKS